MESIGGAVPLIDLGKAILDYRCCIIAACEEAGDVFHEHSARKESLYKIHHSSNSLPTCIGHAAFWSRPLRGLAKRLAWWAARDEGQLTEFEADGRRIEHITCGDDVAGLKLFPSGAVLAHRGHRVGINLEGSYMLKASGLQAQI
ncbi:hypothetical protein [Curtobacterium sp. MCSS17_015]|uniref:hypothetical protein n=1 Tax=Curtobacterium sp. MCSS17_015 TaxID=2175666 RepID=UPI0021AC44E1|nr:hypothetical protein [Curtobacterium sp. MCSS17_015]WIB26618.1 hypothetical protein DEJ18_00575 [Curtobacterium sp. MCSS17_015]